MAYLNNDTYRIGIILGHVLLFLVVLRPQNAVCSEKDTATRAIRVLSSRTESQASPMPDNFDDDPGLEFVLQNGHAHSIEDITIDPTGRFLVSYDYSGALKVWDLKTGYVLKNYQHSQRSRDCNLLAIDPNGKFIATGAEDGQVRMPKPNLNPSAKNVKLLLRNP